MFSKVEEEYIASGTKDQYCKDDNPSQLTYKFIIISIKTVSKNARINNRTKQRTHKEIQV